MTNASAKKEQMIDDNKYLGEQVVAAKEALGNALGMIQDIRDTSLDLGEVTANLAGSVRSLFAAQNSGLVDNKHIGESMDFLRNVLQKMQDILDSEPQLEGVAATVARILATLFPVFKALPDYEQPSVDGPEHVDNEQARAKTAANDPLRKSQFQRPADNVSDRRHEPRVAMDVDIGFASDSNFFTGFSMDISSGGLFVATYDMPKLGTLVELNFKLPKGKVINVHGVVRWIREHNDTTPDVSPGVGVQFDNISKEDAVAINHYMKDAPPLFYDH